MVQVSRWGRSAGCLNRVQDPRTGRQANDPRTAYLAHDMDQQEPGGSRRPCSPLGCESCWDCSCHETDWWAVRRRRYRLGLGGRARQGDPDTEHERRGHKKDEYSEDGKTPGSRTKPTQGRGDCQNGRLRRDSTPMTATTRDPLRRSGPCWARRPWPDQHPTRSRWRNLHTGEGASLGNPANKRRRVRGGGNGRHTQDRGEAVRGGRFEATAWHTGTLGARGPTGKA